jgi:hypothetical protein
MLSRALSLATVTLLIGCLTAVAVRAVENLEAGKSPAQIFAGTCNACHKSPRGLLRSVPASSLSGFLRQHYTTSSDMANVLASYLVSNGATDTRVQRDAKEGKPGKEAAKDGKQEARAPAEQQPAAKQARLPRPGESPDIMRPDQPPAQATTDKGKKGKKGREEPARTEPASEPPKETARETAKGDDGAKPEAEPKTESTKSESAKVESAKVEPAKPAGDPAATRPDPVPAVTPAPSVTAAAPTTSTPAPATSPPSGGYSSPPVQALDGASASAGEQPKPSVPVEIKAPAVAAAPALPPVPPAGPPTVPISQ